MIIEQIYTGCLAHGAYYIESAGEVAIIDPLRETAPYIDRANKNDARIKYIFETHFHADFVSGHIDLAQKTGATIVYGPNAEMEFDAHVAKDGEEFKLGDITIVVLHTPGHTMESSTFLLRDEKGNDHAIFSGDTLFIGDVGRPDLAVKTNLSREDLAGHLYDSLRNKIMPLDDTVVVYPGHGAGSACGKNLSTETQDTLGNQKASNYALRADMSKDEFVKEVLDGILPPPQYFPKNVMLNKQGYSSLDEVKIQGLKALNPTEFEYLANEEEALMLDTREKAEFTKEHIPNSIFIGLDGSFASWVGTLITDIKQPIIFISEPGKEDEVITRLARVGYDNILGYLSGGLHTWKEAGKEVSEISSITAQQLHELSNSQDIKILDVRKPGEYEAQHIEDAQSYPLDYLNNNMAQVTRDTPYYIHCKTGYRSVIASSILQARGFDVVDVAGGFDAIEKTGIKTTDFSCSSKTA